MKRTEQILDKLEELFPQAHCELDYQNIYQLTVAVSLSAQTSDKAVNAVTKELFEKYPDVYALSQADVKQLEEIIRHLGLYRNKAKNLIAMAKTTVNEYSGIIPKEAAQLQRLAGIGRKCANVILAEGYKQPALAVDTHVQRVAIRLKLAPPDADPAQVEKQLCRQIPQARWSRAHHLFIFFGRYLCKARQPLCQNCPFTHQCGYYPARTREKSKVI